MAPVESVEEVRGRLVANVEGFSLQAARHLHECDRSGLEQLLRYMLRPPMSLERLSELPSGKLLLKLKRPLASGTAALELTPMTLMRRLASLVPPPRSHDVCYFGVFSANARWRRRIVPAPPAAERRCHPGKQEHDDRQYELPLDLPSEADALFGRAGLPQGVLDLVKAPLPRDRYLPWADLLRRVYRVDVLRCPCGGTRQVTAFIDDPEVLREVLGKLGLPCEVPAVAKACGPPQREFFDRAPGDDGIDPIGPDFVAQA